jgi:hypothetical protein
LREVKAMPPEEKRPVTTGEPEKTFFDYLKQIWLDSYGDEDAAIAHRHRLAATLGLIAKGLDESQAGYAVRDRLALVCAALLDLDDGVTHPIFKAKKLSHGPRLNSVIWRSRTTIAIAYDYLRKAKVSETVALKQISQIPSLEKLLSGKNPSKEKSPKNWWTVLDRGDFPTDLVREQWGYSREFIAKLTGSPSEKRKVLKAEAERLIAAAAEEIKEI